MKKLVIILIALCTVNAVLAQHHGKKKGSHLKPEDAAALKTKKMTLALDLTNTQQDAVYAIALENAKLKAAHRAEHASKKASGDFQKPTKEERVEMQKKYLDRQIAQKAKMKKILDKDQYAKLERILAKRHAKQKKNGKDCHRKHKA